MPAAETFAANVLASAALVADLELARIDLVYDVYAQEHDIELGIETFKAQLWESARRGELVLASLDMPQTLAPSVRSRCAIERGASTFRAVRVPARPMF